MSSRKRMILKKSWLADHRKLYSRDLPACKSKNTVFQKYTNTKRTNSTCIHIKTKHGWGPIFSSWIIQWEYMGPHQKKGLRVLSNKILIRPVGLDSHESTSLRTHQSHELCCLPSYECTLAVLEVPHNHPNLRSLFYQESGIF